MKKIIRKNNNKILKTLINKGIPPMGGGGCKPVTTILSACSLAALMILGSPAFADEITPTLDQLHEANITMPESTEVYPESAYTLTKVDAPGTNIITKFEFDKEQNKLIPMYYRVDLKQTDYGHTIDYDEVKNFTVTTPNADNTGNAFEYEINYYVNNDRLSPDRITTDQQGADINMDFVGLKKESTSGNAEGGAIYNYYDRIGNITGDFIGNYAQAEKSNAYGGAIYIYRGEIGDITGDFIGNYAQSDNNNVYGGALYTSGEIGDITGDFIGNYLQSDSNIYGGAIYNDGTIGNITGDFIGNYSQSISDYYYYNTYVDGGAIDNEGTIENIAGDFIGNYVQTVCADSDDFYGFYAQGGAIYNNYNASIGNITGDFIGNYGYSNKSSAQGGAIYNVGTIDDITGNFIGNYTQGEYAKGGAIYNYSYSTIGKLDDEGNLIGGIYGSFINNHATTTSTSELALGGAVYTRSDMNFIADNQTNYFSGNYTEDQIQGKIPNAIFVDTSASTPDNPVTIKLQAQNNGTIIFDDQIDGGKYAYITPTIDRTNAYNLALTGDSTGTIYLNNSVINAKVTSENINLNLGKNNVFEQSDFTINSGSLGFINNIAEQQSMKSANITGNINMSVDVNLQNATMDTLPTNTTVTPNAQISVNYLNILNDATSDSTYVKFADPSYANNVQYSGVSPVAYSPIYKYDVSYSTNPEDNLGYFLFTRSGSSSGNASDAYNPAVLAPSVTTQAGAYTTQLQTFNYAFQHSDNFMLIPSFERISIINNNKYALNTTNFSPLLTPNSSSSLWVKPYASFESIPLNNGPKVSNINYGTLIGFDSNLKQINHGWAKVLTGYIGYNGSSQRYQGVDAYQNGGLIGSTLTLYKGNFFNATTISVGASSGNATTMYGNENYTMLMAGIGNKLGYNLEFKNGKFIFQPHLLMSYSFINTFDYTNAAGLKIETDPLHAIQLSPGIKFIMNTKTGWQPYLAVNMTWNILDKTKVTANDVRLPSMSIDPYVSYGAGIQKRFNNEKFTAFGQAMIHNGGRNGISLTTGLRWQIGKEK